MGHALLLGCFVSAMFLCGFLGGVAFAVHPATRQRQGLSLQAARDSAYGALTLMGAGSCVAAALLFALWRS